MQKRQFPPADAAKLRDRAQARLRQLKKPRSKPANSQLEADPRRLLQELQVHQVELELQNAELQESRDRIEALLDKYTDLYDFAPVGYLSLDPQTQILEANLSAAALLGVGRARLIKRRLLAYVLPANRPDVQTFLERVFAGAGKQVCEARLLRENGTSFIASLHGAAAFSASGLRAWCRVVVSDISALKEAEAAQRRLAAIVESSDDAIIGKDLNGIISSWNKGAERIFGYSAGEMVGTSMLRLIPDGRHAEEKLILGKIRRGESVRHFETLRQTKQGQLIHVSITTSPIRDGSGRIIGASKVAHDITERKRAEAMLRRNEALVSALVAQAPVGVYVVDARFCLLQVNPKAQPVFKNVRPLIGRDFSEIIHFIWPQLVADQVVRRFRHTLKTGQSYQSPEFGARRQDTGAQEFYEWQIQRVTLPDGEYGVVCFFSDITLRKIAEAARLRVELLAGSNRKLEAEIVRRQAVEESLQQSEGQLNQSLAQSRRMQEQLRQLSRQVLSAQEEERKRISRELHDVVAQTLTGINIRLATLKKEAGHNTKNFDRSLAHTQELVEHSVNLVHRFARELRPAVLDDLGLIPALHAFMKNFTAQTGVRTHLTAYAGVEQLDTSRRTALFRVAQEALTNVARHARASRVEVNIQKLPHHICMKIKDDGKSFQVQLVLNGSGKKRLGILGMRERLEMVGGHFVVESAPGKGTTIEAQIPLARSHGGESHMAKLNL